MCLLFSRRGLASVRQRALRKGLWFRVLDRVERAIVDLTIRCVERVRSSKLARILVKIVSKLEDAMKSRVERLMDEVGCLLAQKLSRIALNWGNKSADRWSDDPGFIQYLTIMQMNTPRMFQA